ncbi:unnamed protein product [Ixodes persulcatus]
MQDGGLFGTRYSRTQAHEILRACAPRISTKGPFLIDTACTRSNPPPPPPLALRLASRRSTCRTAATVTAVYSVEYVCFEAQRLGGVLPYSMSHIEHTVLEQNLDGASNDGRSEPFIERVWPYIGLNRQASRGQPQAAKQPLAVVVCSKFVTRLYFVSPYVRAKAKLEARARKLRAFRLCSSARAGEKCKKRWSRASSFGFARR